MQDLVRISVTSCTSRLILLPFLLLFLFLFPNIPLLFPSHVPPSSMSCLTFYNLIFLFLLLFLFLFSHPPFLLLLLFTFSVLFSVQHNWLWLRCASNDGLCLADVWAGMLQFSIPDRKAYMKDNIKLDAPGVSVEQKPTTAQWWDQRTHPPGTHISKVHRLRGWKFRVTVGQLEHEWAPLIWATCNWNTYNRAPSYK